MPHPRNCEFLPRPAAAVTSVERAVVVVVVEGSGVVGEICFDDVEPAVAIVVGGIGAHAGLLAACHR